MELEDLKSVFRDIAYDALQKHAEELRRAFGWGTFVSNMDSIAKDVERAIRSMGGGEALCKTGLVIAHTRFEHGTESYGKALISCTIRRPGEKEKLITAYIPMTIEVTLKRPQATVSVIDIGRREDIEVK